ncbi:transglutaminase domain-containing protein [Candidatus Woesearchaeota archaeon]|nr:transglutaminase domain-containing protein [Candidatus Woesearchaeota archaeon]
MKKWVLGLILLFMLANSSAAEEPVDNYNQFESLQLSFSLESGVEFMQTENAPKVEMFQADISFFPKRDGYLQVSDLKTEETQPAEVEIRDIISFKWRNPAPTQLFYKINADVITSNKFIPLQKKITFPLRNVDEKLLEYTKPTEFIDITPEIEQQARSIIGGEDDLYAVVFSVAEWTKKNVEYNLSTLTAEVVQKSSWVLKNRKGVCDELTNLFISMLRSVGIPARFVSGMVYSNLDYKWGAHGWAEVYFPEIGWIPFDVTFGQYGWIDPSHIKLKESLDSGSPSAEYTWRAEGVQVKMKELVVDAKLKDAQGKKESPVKISIQPAYAEAKFKSYVPLIVTAENLENSYISTSVTIKKAPGLTEKNVKEVLLKPRETKNLVWILELPDGEPNYLYTAALEAATSFGNSATAKIRYGNEFKIYSREEAERYLAKATQREEKKQLEGLQMDCNPDQEMYYANDTATIVCNLINTNAENLVLDICIQENCQQTTLAAQQDKTLSFKIQARTNGRIPVIAESSEAIAYTNIELSTIAVPDIYITDVKPDVVDYHDRVILKFNLNADTEVHDMTIDFGFDHFQLDKFKGSREVTIEAPGRNLRNGLKFTVSFLDEKGKPYNLEKAVYLQVTNVPWYAEVIDWIAKVLGIL